MLTTAFSVPLCHWQMAVINQHSVVAIATFKPPAESLTSVQISQPKMSIGSIACRQLLKDMTDALGIVGKLYTSQFPYQFKTPQRAYWVSFSHSQNSVAVLLSTYPYLGVDIETKGVSNALATRFFSQAEKVWLTSLPLDQQFTARTLLWTLKESLIKTASDPNSQLLTGIGCDILTLFGQPSLAHLLTPPTRTRPWQTLYINDFQLGYCSYHRSAFVIRKPPKAVQD